MRWSANRTPGRQRPAGLHHPLEGTRIADRRRQPATAGRRRSTFFRRRKPMPDRCRDLDDVLRPGRNQSRRADAERLVGRRARRLNVPVVQAICASTMRWQWEASSRGLNPLDTAMNVALPEFDGRIITVPISFKEAPSARDQRSRLPAVPLASMSRDPERIGAPSASPCGSPGCGTSRTATSASPSSSPTRPARRRASAMRSGSMPRLR